MRLFEVSLISKVFDKGDRVHAVERKVVLAGDADQARERAMEAESLPEGIVAAMVEDLGDAVVANAGHSRMPSSEVRAILRDPGAWTVLSDELAMPEREAFRL